MYARRFARMCTIFQIPSLHKNSLLKIQDGILLQFSNSMKPHADFVLLSGDNMSKTVCFCHNYSESDIEKDVQQNNGRSRILEEIITAKQKGACQCSTKHPEERFTLFEPKFSIGGRRDNHCDHIRHCFDSSGPLGGVRDNCPAAPRDSPLPTHPFFLPEQLAPMGEDGQIPASGTAAGNLAELFWAYFAPVTPECLGRRPDHRLRPHSLDTRISSDGHWRRNRLSRRPLPEWHYILYPWAGRRPSPHFPGTSAGGYRIGNGIRISGPGNRLPS